MTVTDFLLVYDAEDIIDEEELEKATKSEDFTISYAPLNLKVKEVSKTTQTLYWVACEEADGYVVYGSKDTGKGINEMIPLTMIRNNKTNSWTRYDLTEGAYYQYYVKAYKLVDGNMQFLTQSKSVYAVTNGSEYVNTAYVRLNTKNFIMKKGSDFELISEEIKEKGKQKMYAQIAFESTDDSIASVDENGVITAKKAGICHIYTIAQNGVTARVCVVVVK